MQRSLLATVVMALAAATVSAQSPDWTYEMISASGSELQMVLAPDGEPAVAYLTTVKRQTVLAFARKDPTTGEWKSVTLPVGQGRTIPSLSYGMLAGDPANPVLEPMLAYASLVDHVLMFARPESPDAPVVIDQNVWVPSLSVNPVTHYPAIAYCTAPDQTVLKLAQWDGSAWSTEIVASGENFRDYSLAFAFNGTPAIAWKSGDDSSANLLRFAWKDPVLGWCVQPVAADANSYSNQSVSLAFNPASGAPSIAYASGGFGAAYGPRFAFYDVTTQQWTSERFWTDNGSYLSMAYTPDGTPFISCQGVMYPPSLIVSHKTPFGWHHEPLGSYAADTSTAIGPDGTPSVAYVHYSGTELGLIFAKRSSLQFGAAVTILTPPTSRAEFNIGTPIEFLASASALTLGDCNNALVWTSNRDGVIGTGANFFTNTLSGGQHSITASAAYAGETPGMDSIGIYVLGNLRVWVTYAMQGRDLIVTVSLTDEFGNPAPGSSSAAWFDLYRNGKRAASYHYSANAEGQVVYRHNNAAAGTYTTVVTNASAIGLTWDGATQPNSFTVAR